MSRTAAAPSPYATFLTALLLVFVLAGPTSSLPSGHPSTAPRPKFRRSVGLGHDHIRDDDRISRRDFTWHDDANNLPRDICGDSTFATAAAVDDDPSPSPPPGPSAADCATFVASAERRPGFWLVTGFDAAGRDWVEFATLGSCKLAMRHVDGGSGAVPIGNQDVIDLLNSVMAASSGDGGTLLTMEGNMTCSREPSTATVEWRLSSV